MTFQLTKAQLVNYFNKQLHQHHDHSVDEQKLTPAAVLIPIIDEQQGLMMLFTERTQHLKNHPGQISFPGGRLEAQDQNLEDTALRETQEEIGLSRDQLSVIGELSCVTSIAGFLVKPFVGLITPPLKLTLDPAEVAGIFTAPLDFILDASNQQEQIISFEGKNKKIYVIEYEGHRIWGMTAKILVKLREELTLSLTGRG